MLFSGIDLHKRSLVIHEHPFGMDPEARNLFARGGNP
jgi:hypothetical protein